MKSTDFGFNLEYANSRPFIANFKFSEIIKNDNTILHLSHFKPHYKCLYFPLWTPSQNGH